MAQDARTWRSADGTQAMQASFIEYDSKSKTVELETSNSNTVKVRLTNLSPADQRFVKLIARKNRKARPLSIQTEKSENTVAKSKQRAANVGRKLFGINWTLDLENALVAARGRETPADDRPVMWLRVLGDLNGYM